MLDLIHVLLDLLVCQTSTKVSTLTNGPVMPFAIQAEVLGFVQGAGRQGSLLRRAGQYGRGLHAHGPHHPGTAEQAERASCHQAELLAAGSCGLCRLQLPPLP